MYTITYVYNGVTHTTKQFAPGAAYSEDGVGQPDTPGAFYTWDGWSGPYAVGQAVTGPATYTGSFTYNGVAISFIRRSTSSGDSSIDADLKIQTVYKNTPTNVTVPTVAASITNFGNVHYAFSHWSPSITGSTVTVNTATPITYTAYYESQSPQTYTYSITVSADNTYHDSLNQGSVSVSLSCGVYRGSATITNDTTTAVITITATEDDLPSPTITGTWKGISSGPHTVSWGGHYTFTSADFGSSF
jgi:hypothetical protein